MAKQSVAIIDCGSGNLRSALRAFEHGIAAADLDMQAFITNRAEDLDIASHIVLPGQGAFGSCMEGLRALPGMLAALEDNVRTRAKPFMGICVGMQLMAGEGHEHGIHSGLGWIAGRVVPMKPSDSTLKIPHMGWNDTHLTPAGKSHFVLRSTDQPSHYYFVHSFVFECENGGHVLASADYGGDVPAIIGRDNMIGTQFHPEKSHDAGLALIRNFLSWRP